VSHAEQLASYDGCARLRPEWDRIARDYDAVVVPSAVDEGPKGIENTGDPVSSCFSCLNMNNEWLNGYNMKQTLCSMWTIIGAPALNIPGFSGQNGLPIGLSVVGARYTDLQLLHVAKAIGAVWEAEGGWWHKLF
jgi:Asp-tRNA(Asn)/Glu-tRNA(Gln) amidotransferase A subunit family amidase